MSGQGIGDPLAYLVDQSQVLLTVLCTVLAATEVKPKKLRVTVIDDHGEHQDITMFQLMRDYENLLKRYKEQLDGVTQ